MRFRAGLLLWHPDRSTTDPVARVNRLAVSTSPSMRLHAKIPLDWREWSEDAFAESRECDVPNFLSVICSSSDRA